MTSTVYKGKTIYIEGCDLSGKTSLIKHLLPYEINNNTFLSDRSYATSIIYAEYFGRKNVDIAELKNNFLYQLNSNKSLYWFLNPNNEEIIKRSELREEKHIKNVKEILKIKKLYEEFFNEYNYYENIKVYDDNDGVSRKILTLEKEINEKFNNNELLFDYNNLLKTLFNKLDHEIIGYRLNYNIENYDKLNSMESKSWNITKHNLIELKMPDFDLIYDKEKHERQMVISNLKFNTHIMINKYNESIESRRFLSINDSCFSFTQVNIRKDSINFSFVLRSTNVHKMLPVDLIFIFDLIKKYISWLSDYCDDNSIDRFDLYNTPIKIDIVMNSAHLVME